MGKNDPSQRLVLKSRAEYETASRRAAELRSQGATAATNHELARLEGAIALYAAEPGKPATRKGRPEDEGSTP